MAATSYDLQRMLDDAGQSAKAAGLGLREQLRKSESAAGALVSFGQVSSVSKNSVSTSYAYGPGTLTSPDAARAWRVLINLFDDVAGWLASTDDDAIAAEMHRNLRCPRNEFAKTFDGIYLA